MLSVNENKIMSRGFSNPRNIARAGKTHIHA
jgi:hypothetical protein